jgi:hypothetical protein
MACFSETIENFGEKSWGDQEGIVFQGNFSDFGGAIVPVSYVRFLNFCEVNPVVPIFPFKNQFFP